MENKIEIKENYFFGVLGAILGGLVIAIPLAFVYIYSELPLLLAITVLFPLFEFYMYKWFKGKIDTKLPIILLIVTVINILIMMLLVIPIALSIKANLPITILAIKSVYSNTKTALAIVQDCLTSLVISMLGVYMVSAIIKRKLLLNIFNINLFSSDNKERIDLKENLMRISSLIPNERNKMGVLNYYLFELKLYFEKIEKSKNCELSSFLFGLGIPNVGNKMAKIMVVDDAAFMRMMVKNALAQGGYTDVCEASDGNEAVQMYTEQQPQLVLMDITMPNMDGLEALKKIREIDGNSQVVMCSAMGQESMVIEAIKAGAKDFIVKPFKPERILSTVDGLIGK